MPRSLKIATVQMDATPAPVTDRLDRAAALVAEAAASGAELVVLPEIFNIGYEYSDRNYSLPETVDGTTVTWMKDQATEHGIYLAGSLLLRDNDEVYNSQLIVAPDGRIWRYDKQYPWAWERAYFREGSAITVADTDLGRLGMMICWDYAHPELWQRYAGQVDAMVMTSCPPAGHQLRINGSETTMTIDYPDGDSPFGSDLDALTAWMRVPLVNSSSSGHFESRLPLSPFSTAVLGQPSLNATATAGFIQQAKIVNADGEVLARITEDGDGLTLAEVTLADQPPKPLSPPPRSYPWTVYFMADWLAPAAMVPLYRRGYRRQFGPRMSPVSRQTRMWLAGMTVSFVVGRISAPRRSGRRKPRLPLVPRMPGISGQHARRKPVRFPGRRRPGHNYQKRR